MGQAGRVNVVFQDDVQGRVTMKVHNTDWRRAFGTVLRANGLGMIKEGNVIWVARRDTVQQVRDEEAQQALDTLQKRTLPERIKALGTLRLYVMPAAEQP